MSVDWFLFSPSTGRRVMVGSIGLSGSKTWPDEYGGRQFLRWAIETNTKDVVLVDENDPRLDESDPDEAPK